jgi:hypothetical protein
MVEADESVEILKATNLQGPSLFSRGATDPIERIGSTSLNINPSRTGSSIVSRGEFGFVWLGELGLVRNSSLRDGLMLRLGACGDADAKVDCKRQCRFGVREIAPLSWVWVRRKP